MRQAQGVLRGGALAPSSLYACDLRVPRVRVAVVAAWKRSRFGDSVLPIELCGTKMSCNVFTIPLVGLVPLSLNDRFPQLTRG